jgi:hypothetical protein
MHSPDRFGGGGVEKCHSPLIHGLCRSCPQVGSAGGAAHVREAEEADEWCRGCQTEVTADDLGRRDPTA